MRKVSVYSKKAFTLAETIMTLVVLSLVVTAAIPVFTAKQGTLSGNEVKEPWNYCDETEKRGLCTTKEILLGGLTEPHTYSRTDGADRTASVSLQTSNQNANIFDIVRSDNRWFKVGEHNIKEVNTLNFLATPNLPNSIGTKNIIIGSAGNNIQNYNIVVGNNTDGVTGSNNIVIGNGNTVGSNNNIVMGSNNSIIGSGSIVVGSGLINVRAGAIAIGAGATGAAANTLNIDGQIIATLGAEGNPTTTTFSGDVEVEHNFMTDRPQNIASDKRLKNIQGSYNKGLNEILQIEPVNFYYKGSSKNNIHTGIVAQDIQKIFPEAVVKMPDGYYAVNNDPIFFAMLNSLKEINETTSVEEKKQQQMQKELADLKAEIETLNGCNSNSFICQIKYLFYDIKNFFKSIFEVKYEKI